MVFNWGYPLGVAMGVKGVYCSLWELLVGRCFSISHIVSYSIVFFVQFLGGSPGLLGDSVKVETVFKTKYVLPLHCTLIS